MVVHMIPVSGFPVFIGGRWHLFLALVWTRHVTFQTVLEKLKKSKWDTNTWNLKTPIHVSFEIQIGYRQIKRKSKCCMSFHPTNNKISKNSTHHWANPIQEGWNPTNMPTKADRRQRFPLWIQLRKTKASHPWYHSWALDYPSVTFYL